MTDPDEISDDINTYFQSVTLPETEKTVYKCSFCEKTWERIVSTARKDHLASRQLAKLYSTTLCPMVPKTVSLHFIEMLNVATMGHRVVESLQQSTYQHQQAQGNRYMPNSRTLQDQQALQLPESVFDRIYACHGACISIGTTFVSVLVRK